MNQIKETYTAEEFAKKIGVWEGTLEDYHKRGILDPDMEHGKCVYKDEHVEKYYKMRARRKPIPVF